MNKRKIKKFEEQSITIVQILGNNEKNKKQIEKNLFELCNKLDINIVVRVVEKSRMSRNFDYLEILLKDKKGYTEK